MVDDYTEMTPEFISILKRAIDEGLIGEVMWCAIVGAKKSKEDDTPLSILNGAANEWDI